MDQLEKRKAACKAWRDKHGSAYHKAQRAKRKPKFDAFKEATKFKRGDDMGDGHVFLRYSINAVGFIKTGTVRDLEALRAKDSAAHAYSAMTPEKLAKTRAAVNLRSAEHRKKNAGTPEHREYHAAYLRKRRIEDPLFLITNKIRGRLLKSVKRAKAEKRTRRITDAETVTWLHWLAVRLNVDMRDHKSHHIDHLRPARCFDLTTAEGQRAFNAPENTWWLSAADNLAKNDSDPTEQQLQIHKELLAEYHRCKAYTSKVSPA